MKTILIAFSALLACSPLCRGQKTTTNLLAQSPDGKTVKLVWFMNSIPSNFSGFDIKRKDGLGSWVKLNTEPLLPGISVKKSLTMFEKDNTEATRIQNKLKDLIKAGKLKEYDYPSFLTKWKQSDKEILDIIYLAGQDFDISVMCGFGYVDHSLTQKTDYQYGVFSHSNNELLDSAMWNYGEIPDLNVIREITSQAGNGKKGIRLIWIADEKKMKSSYVAGFNIYKKGMRLNELPIVSADAAHVSDFGWDDVSASGSTAEQYSISAQSLFGIEGIIKSYTYDPAQHPLEYKKTVVTNVLSSGFYFKDGITVEWNFPVEDEQYVKGFYVEKDNMPDGYKRVSELLPASTRTYIDKTGSSVSSKIRMKVVALYHDRTLVPGVEMLYSYFPMIDPPKPLNTHVTGGIEHKKFVMRISWDSIINGDAVTKNYKVYSYNPSTRRYYVLADKLPVGTTSYTYTVESGLAADYHFFVRALSLSGMESEPGDTVVAKSLSLDLPAPNFIKNVTDGSKVYLMWVYPDVADLLGFRLYADGVLIADENILGKTVKAHVLEGIEPGTTTTYTLCAITVRGVTGPNSAPATVTIPATSKRK
jgi:hypothetical protein